MTRGRPSHGEWTSPMVVIATLSIVLTVVGSYLTMQRDDSERIARLEEQAKILLQGCRDHPEGKP